MVCCLIQLFRNCLNQNGFEAVTGITPIEDDVFELNPSVFSAPSVQVDGEKKTDEDAENYADDTVVAVIKEAMERKRVLFT
jgi:hypothetical protein